MSPDNNGGVNSDFDTRLSPGPHLQDSLRAAVENGEVSASYLQRRFRIGLQPRFPHHGRHGTDEYSGPSTGSSKPREVLIGEEELQNLLQRPSE